MISCSGKILYRIFWISLFIPFAIPCAYPENPQLLYNGWNLEQEAATNPSIKSASFAKGDLYIIQSFSFRLGTTFRAEWKNKGANVIAYIPRKAWLIQIQDPKTFKESLSTCSLVLPLQSPWKVERDLWDLNLPEEAEVPLVLHATCSSEDLTRAVETAGGNITNLPLTPGKPRLGVKVQSQNLPLFLSTASRFPDIYSIEPGFGAKILNDNASAIMQSGSPGSGRPVWDRGLHGEGQVIAVLDTGVDFDSCYFIEDNHTTPPLVMGTGKGEPDLSRRKIIIYDLLYDQDYGADRFDFDNHGHGTRVSGSALGSMLNNPLGTSVYNGAAPLARLIVQDAGFDGWDNCADLAALGCPVVDLVPFLEQAIRQGAHIHNNSWGDRENLVPLNLYTGPTADMDEVVWKNPDFVIVCAAGNSGASGSGTVSSPSTGKNVLSVGATRSPSSGGSADQLAIFSSRGWAADGRIKPDLTAPGETITALSDGDVTSFNCGTASIQGTSFSSPFTAGCAALVRQYYREGWYPSGRKNPDHATTPTAALIKATLLSGTVDMAQTSAKPPNREEGWGRVHLDNSLYFKGDARRLIVADQRDYFFTTAARPFVLRFHALGHEEGGLLKIALVWTDYPADPAASISLVNDLDLVVKDLTTSGTVYYGNNIDSGVGMPGYSIPFGSPDNLNNVEMVILAPDTKGLFEVWVEPSLIVEPPQGFALVIGGDVKEYEPPRRNAWLFYGKIE